MVYGVVNGEPQAIGMLSENYAALYSGRNNIRLESYHRLDLGIKDKWTTKKGKRSKLNGDVYNAYSRMNAAFYFYNHRDQNDLESKIGIKKSGIFPITPTIKYVRYW